MLTPSPPFYVKQYAQQTTHHTHQQPNHTARDTSQKTSHHPKRVNPRKGSITTFSPRLPRQTPSRGLLRPQLLHGSCTLQVFGEQSVTVASALPVLGMGGNENGWEWLAPTYWSVVAFASIWLGVC